MVLASDAAAEVVIAGAVAVTWVGVWFTATGGITGTVTGERIREWR